MIEVVAAVIKYKDLYLCAQKGFHKKDYMSYKFEFPGGKIEVGETAQEALVREIYEELDLKVDVLDTLITVEHNYPDFCLKMTAYLCSCANVDLTLKEHVRAVWLPLHELKTLDWAAADVPVVSYLENL